jgi:gliding motility-associated-like protein
MGSGDVQVAPGPNNQGGASLGGGFIAGVDPDLAAITPNTVYDEAILEFDFVPQGDSIEFQYVFASEEYDEYVCGSVNDAFGFFISGPGITGPFSNNGANIALIPGTTTPVSINTVNLGVSGMNGTPANCTAIDPNWASYNIYYTQNTQQSIQYDGKTVILTAFAAVQCGETYHIKLAIGDAGDGAFDSGVFLQEGSFSSNGVSITASSVTGGNTIAEGCGTAIFTFNRPDTTGNFTIHFDIGGTATPGSDYTSVPDSIIIPQGQTSATVTVDAFTDSNLEPQETITFFIIYSNGCGNDTVQATIYIDNVEILQVEVGAPSEICTDAGEFAILSASATGGYGPLTYVWDNGGGVGDTVVVTPGQTINYQVTVTDTCGNSDTEFLEVIVNCDIVVPNVFTPNGDGQNDVFRIQYMDDYPNSRLVIFNRWGRKVFETDNYQNNWGGDGAADGTYYYIVTPSDPDQPEQHGHVTIIREK